MIIPAAYTGTGRPFVSQPTKAPSSQASLINRVVGYYLGPLVRTKTRACSRTCTGASENYPFKDPFLQLLKGSLANFVNALTHKAYTVYPFASQDLQDSYNLMDFYLDAVFHHLLRGHTFDQERWQDELESKEGPLLCRGVVYQVETLFTLTHAVPFFQRFGFTVTEHDRSVEKV